MACPLLLEHDDVYVAVVFEMMKEFLTEYDGAVAQQILKARGVLNVCLEVLLKCLPVSVLYKDKF